MFEGINAAVPHQCFHILVNLIIPVRHCDMETIVGRRFFGFAPPRLPRVMKRLSMLGDDEIDNTCCASGEPGGCACIEIVTGRRAHKGHFHMRMGIYPPWHDKQPICINDGTAGRRFHIRLNSRDFPAIVTQDVCSETPLRRNNCSTLDQEHDIPSIQEKWLALCRCLTETVWLI